MAVSVVNEKGIVKHAQGEKYWFHYEDVTSSFSYD